ncbi:MAG: hypothetical protein FJY85_17805, partial [Deltaproteobacteria bacterium]|nr:hypothetical protein [Deltaproteobacteria bacterium]
MDLEIELELTGVYVRERAELFRSKLVEWELERTLSLVRPPEAKLPYTEFRDILSKEAFALVRSELAARNGTAGPGTRNLLHFIMRSLVEASCHPVRMELQDQLASLKVPIGKEQVPLTQATARILSEKRRAERDCADKARTALFPRLDPTAQRLIERAHSVAELLGFPNYPAMWEETSGITFAQVEAHCRPIIEETKDPYEEMLDWFSRKVLDISGAKLKRHDVLHLFYGGFADEFFPITDFSAIAIETASEM